MKAALGGLSGVVVVVTHVIPSPGSGFDATQPDGNAGAVTLSKFSVHGPEGVGVGLGPPPAVAVAVAVGLGPPPAVAVAVGVGLGPPGVGVGIGGPWPISYTSTRPTPVVLFTPANSAV